MTNTVSRIHTNDFDADELLLPMQPWWCNLPEDFSRKPDHFDLDRWDWLRVQATARVDALSRTGLASAVGTAALPSLLSKRRMEEEKRNLDFYNAFVEHDDPHAFFREPRAVPRMTQTPVDWFHFQPNDGEAVNLSFESPFEPVNPSLHTSYLQHKRNRTAWAQYWRHHDGPRPTLVFVHGFVADPYWLNTRFLALPWFFKRGYDVLLYTMPFHGQRQGRHSPFSGSGFFSHGISHINEAFAQTIHDLRIFLNWLRARSVPRLGVTGISLGGYTTALLSCIDDDLDFVIPNVPVVSLVDLMVDWWPLNVPVRTAMKRHDLRLSDLRKVTAMHSPLTWPSRVSPRNRLIVGGAGDRFVPPKQVWLLREHWHRCRTHWFPGNHLVHLDQGRYLREMLAFMEGSSL